MWQGEKGQAPQPQGWDGSCGLQEGSLAAEPPKSKGLSPLPHPLPQPCKVLLESHQTVSSWHLTPQPQIGRLAISFISESAPDKKSTPLHQRGPLGSSLTQWTWVWANSRRWWRTGKPGVLQSTGSQRVRHNLVTTTTGVMVTKWSTGDISGKTPTDTWFWNEGWYLMLGILVCGLMGLLKATVHQDTCTSGTSCFSSSHPSTLALCQEATQWPTKPNSV